MSEALLFITSYIKENVTYSDNNTDESLQLQQLYIVYPFFSQISTNKAVVLTEVSRLFDWFISRN